MELAEQAADKTSSDPLSEILEITVTEIPPTEFVDSI